MTTTRFAPSPTGYLHVGNLRAALFNFLIARKAGGKFILRIDDTDTERSRPEYVEAIKADLDWLGLHWDRIEYQSARLDRYAAAADSLRAEGRLYECFESAQELDIRRRQLRAAGKPPVYDRSALNLSDEQKKVLRETTPGYWRFLLDRQRVEWNDAILGPQSIDAASLSDPVLIRADRQVLYTLASVVDDVEMGITHVVRGADHVTNTATQIQLAAALGGVAPVYAHHALLVGPDGAALSKREGAAALRDLREAGTQPMALLSLMARIGSADPVVLADTPLALAEGFDLARFGAAPTRYDPADLAALSLRALRARTATQMDAQMAEAGVPAGLRAPFWNMLSDNVESTADIALWWAICQGTVAPVVIDEDRAFVIAALRLLPAAPHDENTWGTWTRAVAQATGREGRGLFLPLRRALTGQDSGPDMARLLPLLQRIPATDLIANQGE